LGANKEAKAATLTLNTNPFFLDGYESGWAYRELNSEYEGGYPLFSVKRTPGGEERRAFYEYDISNLPPASNQLIRATLSTPIRSFQAGYRRFYLSFFGYVGNGSSDLSDFNAGIRLGSEDAYDPIPDPERPRDKINFDVTYFIKELVSNRDYFAGFRIGVDNSDYPISGINYGDALLRGYYDVPPTLIIETVPEPTTIFGSALALGVGGWLKRKKSSQQNKTTSQH
jgi:hypothetical protein